MTTFEFLAEHGASVLFWVIFVEQIGFPLPALPLLVAAGALVATGHMSLATALLVPVVASLPPDLAWYYLGRLKGGNDKGVRAQSQDDGVSVVCTAPSKPHPSASGSGHKGGGAVQAPRLLPNSPRKVPSVRRGSARRD